MRKSFSLKNVIRVMSRFFTIFVFVAFIVTCCLSLFISLFTKDLGLELTNENVQTAAKLTFANSVFISLIFTVADGVRRKLTVDRYVKKIAATTKRIVEGDFSARVPKPPSFAHDENLNYVSDCINEMAEELSSIETLRSDLIANVSHEMKTPLAVIKNYCTLLTSSELDEKKRIDYVKSINEAVVRLSDMMTNVLKLNRLENQQIYPQAKRYDLGEQLCECLLQYENVWESKNIQIETDLDDGVYVCADGELLSLVWSNLFSNAFKFTKEGGKVTLTLKSDEAYATVKVEDTGCGMSSEVGKHIFEKFYQGDASRASQGNGLGLALVKRVMDIVNGEISVESTLGVGTTFTVRIERGERREV